MAIKKSDLYASIWASCNQLRGGMDAIQYKDCVLFMLHEAKQRLLEDRWRKALGWMGEKGRVAQGVTFP
jgi:hypothetical protein